MDALKNLPLKRLNEVEAALRGPGAKVKRHKDKPTAIKAVGKASKQKIVEALARTGGVSVEEIQELFSIRKAYARDILSKLTKKGLAIERGEDGLFRA